MKSLISSYLNSRRSVRIEETILDVTETATEKEKEIAPTTTNATNSNEIAKSSSSSSQEETETENKATISSLNLKFIDDNDSDSISAQLALSSRSGSPPLIQPTANTNHSINHATVLNHLDRLKSNLENYYSFYLNKSAEAERIELNAASQQQQQQTSITPPTTTTTTSSIKLKKFNILDNTTTTTTNTNANTTNNLVSSSHRISNNVNNNSNQTLRIKYNSDTSNNCSNNSSNESSISSCDKELIEQIKTCLCLLSENYYFLNAAAAATTSSAVTNLKTEASKEMNGESDSSQIESLAKENQVLKERLDEIEELRKQEENELLRIKETFEMMKSDRKRLKCEKLELLNQTRDLYKVIESKENEIRDVLKAYELRTKETSFAVKKIIDGKVEIEREKSKLELYIMDLVEEKNQLNLVVESKNAMIGKLQKQIYEIKSSNSPRNSLGKESDCGYSSSSTKSRDTLSSSLIDNTASSSNNTTINPASSHNQTPTKKLSSSSSRSSSSSAAGRSTNQILAATNTLKAKSNDDSVRSSSVVVAESTTTVKRAETTKVNDDDGEIDLMSRALVGHTDEFIDLDDDDDDIGGCATSEDSNHLHEAKDETISDEFNSDEVLHIVEKPTVVTTASSSLLCSSKSVVHAPIQQLANESHENGQKISSNMNMSPSTSLASSSSGVVSSASSFKNDDSATQIKLASTKTEDENVNPIAPTTITTTPSTSGLNIKSRSSRILNTLIRMSTIGNGMILNGHNNQSSHHRSSVIIEPSATATTLSSSKVQSTAKTAAATLTPTHQQQQPIRTLYNSGTATIMRNSTNNLSSKSSFYVNELAAAASASATTVVTSSASTNKLYKSTYFTGSTEHTATKFDTLFPASSHRHSFMPSTLKTRHQTIQSSSKMLTSSMMDTTMTTNKENVNNQSSNIIREETSIKSDLISSSSSSASLSMSDEAAAKTIMTSASSTSAECEKNASEWSSNRVKQWLQSIGMLPFQVKNAMKFISNGKSLIQMNDAELEKAFALNNSMHRRKLRLAIDDLKSPEKSKYPKLNDINTDWITTKWLKEIGLVQYASVFKLNLVDGRMLASLQKKDLEKHFGMQKRYHQTSLMLAIEFLRKHDFDIKKLKSMREDSQCRVSMNQFGDVNLWTNENFIDWLNLVNLQAFLPALGQSGLHGALVADNAFNTDFLYSSLGVTNEQKYQNMKKIIDDEIKLLKKSKTFTKNDSVLQRPLASFKNDKRIFTFRGSLGRALGKKIKRDISSPLIDDDTYKRIDFGHKLVDMKDISHCSAV